MSSSANIVSLFLEQVKAQPEGLVLKVPRRSWLGKLRYTSYTFAELNATVNATAHYLAQKGIEGGGRVLLAVKPSVEFLQIVFALFKIGAVPILLDPGLGLKSYLKSIQQSKVKALIGVGKGIALSRLCPKAFPELERRIWIGPWFSKVLQPYFAYGPFPVYPSQPEDLAAILFTSGSTGVPKGVCYQHRHFKAQVESVRKTYHIKPQTVDLPLLAIFILFNPVLGCLSILPELDASQPAKLKPEKIVQAILENGVQTSFGSPTLWSKLADYSLAKGLTLPSIKRILIAGASLSPDLLRKLHSILPKAAVHTPYGATEALPVSTIEGKTLLRTRPPFSAFAGTCLGKPVKGVNVRIIAPQEGPIVHFSQATCLAAGAVGEIIVQGPMVTETYDHLEGATALAKIPDEDGCWHRMGDLGYIDSAGLLWFCGRKIETIQTPTGPIYTEPCERMFRGHPRIHRVAVIAYRQAAALVVEPKKDHFPKNKAERLSFQDDLLAFARSYPHTQAIQTIFFKSALPVDVRHNAKIHRLKLREEYKGKD